MAGFKVLRATKKDLTALLALNVALNEFVMRLEKRGKRERGYKRKLKRFYERQLSAKNKSRAVLLKAVDENGEVIGLVRASVVDAIPIFEEKRFLQVSDVFVKPRWRRRGIATALVRGALSWGKRRGVKHAELILEEKNAAASALYASLGFAEWQKRLRKKL